MIGFRPRNKDPMTGDVTDQLTSSLIERLTKADVWCRRTSGAAYSFDAIRRTSRQAAQIGCPNSCRETLQSEPGVLVRMEFLLRIADCLVLCPILSATPTSLLRRVRGIVYCCQRIKENSLFRGRVRYGSLCCLPQSLARPCIATNARADGMEIRDGKGFAAPRIRIAIRKCL